MSPLWTQRHVGALGFSWGGTAALQLALRHKGIDAVASLDGGHGFPQYRPVAEDFPFWSPQNLEAPFLHVVPEGQGRLAGFDPPARYADTYTCTLPGLRHSDFSADAIEKYRMATADSAYADVAQIYNALVRRIKTFFDAYLKGDAEALSRLNQTKTDVAGSAWTASSALPPLPTPGQFDALIETQGVAAAVERFHAIRQADSTAVVFDEQRLFQYVYAWGPDRADDLLALLNLNLEVYPRSADTHFWLAQVYLAKEEPAKALAALERALAMDPDHGRAGRLLTRLKGASSAADSSK